MNRVPLYKPPTVSPVPYAIAAAFQKFKEETKNDKLEPACAELVSLMEAQNLPHYSRGTLCKRLSASSKSNGAPWKRELAEAFAQFLNLPFVELFTGISASQTETVVAHSLVPSPRIDGLVAHGSKHNYLRGPAYLDAGFAGQTLLDRVMHSLQGKWLEVVVAEGEALRYSVGSFARGEEWQFSGCSFDAKGQFLQEWTGNTLALSRNTLYYTYGQSNTYAGFGLITLRLINNDQWDAINGLFLNVLDESAQRDSGEKFVSKINFTTMFRAQKVFEIAKVKAEDFPGFNSGSSPGDYQPLINHLRDAAPEWPLGEVPKALSFLGDWRARPPHSKENHL